MHRTDTYRSKWSNRDSKIIIIEWVKWMPDREDKTDPNYFSVRRKISLFLSLTLSLSDWERNTVANIYSSYFSFSFSTFGKLGLGTFKRVLGFQNNSYSCFWPFKFLTCRKQCIGKSFSWENVTYSESCISKKRFWDFISPSPFRILLLLFSFYFAHFCPISL